MKKETSIIKKGSDLPMVAEGQRKSWGSENVDATDILIPKILMMQPTSELVAEGKAQVGDLVNSLTKKVIAAKGSSVAFIPLTSNKEWVIMKQVGSKFEYFGKEAMTEQNADAPLEWTKDKEVFRRDRALNFYVLLPQDIERERVAFEKMAKEGEYPDPDDALLPVVLQFKRTSYNAGRVLITHFAKADAMEMPPSVSTFKLTTKHEKNDRGQYFITEVEKAGKTTTEELQVCKKWYDIIARSAEKIRVDDSEGETVDVTVEVQQSKTMNQNF